MSPSQFSAGCDCGTLKRIAESELLYYLFNTGLDLYVHSVFLLFGLNHLPQISFILKDHYQGWSNV